jgi:hypothetical protein
MGGRSSDRTTVNWGSDGIHEAAFGRRLVDGAGL